MKRKHKMGVGQLVGIVMAAVLLLGIGIEAAVADTGIPAAISKDIIVTPTARPLADIQAPSGSLNVTAWVNHANNIYAIGDTVEIYVKANQDAYITLLDVGTSGKVHVIFPNKFQTNNYVLAGQVVRIGGSNAPFLFQVTGPTGTELVKVFATKNAQQLVSANSMSQAGPFKAVNKSCALLAKDIEVILKPQTGNQWSEYNKVLKIVNAR